MSETEWQYQPDPATLAVLVAIDSADRSDEQNQKLDDAFLRQDAVLGPVRASLTDVTKELDAIRKTIPTTMVLQELETTNRNPRRKDDGAELAKEVGAEVAGR